MNGPTRAQQLAFVSAVMRAIPDPVEQRAVLDAVFAKGRKRRRSRSGRGRRAGKNSRRLATAEKACGTPRGHAQHRYHGEEICDDCRAAHTQEMRERRAAARATVLGPAP